MIAGQDIAKWEEAGQFTAASAAVEGIAALAVSQGTTASAATEGIAASAARITSQVTTAWATS